MNSNLQSIPNAENLTEYVNRFKEIKRQKIAQRMQHMQPVIDLIATMREKSKNQKQ